MRSLLFTMFCWAPMVALAQTGGLYGTVSDENGPLPGVGVAIKDVRIGTVTDLNGAFRLQNIPAGAQVLILRYVGFDTREIPVTITAGAMSAAGDIRLQSSNTIQELTVRGALREGEAKAINMMLQSERLVTVVSAEGIGKLPDKNAAEAMQRLVGAAMERDQGEGRWISFRGTPSDWSAALINGDRMPAADEESKTRAMNFDILPANMIEYVLFSKSLTPDMESDAIGGSANFITRIPPRGQYIEAQLGAGYNDQSRKPIGSASLLYGNRSRNGKWGYVGGLSWYNRNWGTDNYQVFFNSNFNHAITRLELRDYLGNRETQGFNGAIEFSPNEKHHFHLKGMYGRMRDNEYNRKILFAYNTGVGQSIKLQTIHNILITRFIGGELGAKHRLGERLQADWKIASYHNRFRYGNVPFDNGDARNGYFVVEFEKNVQYTDFLYLDENGQPTDEFNAVERYKLLDIDSPVRGYGDHYQNIQPTWRDYPAFFEKDTLFLFSRAYTETNQTKESDPVVARIDLTWTPANNLRWQAGLKYRYKTGERKVTLEFWDRNTQVFPYIRYKDFALENAPGNGGFLQEINEPYRHLNFQFLSKEALGNFIQGLGEGLIYQPFSTQTPYFEQFVGSSYRYTESVAAAYGLADWTPHPDWRLNMGMRVEYTAPDVKADSVILGLTIDEAYLISTAAGRNYWALLPMLNLKWQARERWNLRFAATRSFRRPNFNEIKPGQAAIDYTNFDLVYGNTDLRPSYALNLDLTSEWYFGLNGMASAGVFYKHITDHIYTAFESSSLDATGISNQFQIPGGIISKKYQNAPEAYAAGVEMVWNRKFDFLNGFWQHFGINANYAYTASSMTIDSREKKQPLPRQSKHIWNVGVFFENATLALRLAWNHRSPYLAELNLFAVNDPVTGVPTVIHQDNDFDLFVGVSESLDFSGQLQLGKGWVFFAEASNLSNAPYLLYRGRPERPVKTEYYSWRGQIGLRYRLQAP